MRIFVIHGELSLMHFDETSMLGEIQRQRLISGTVDIFAEHDWGFIFPYLGGLGPIPFQKKYSAQTAGK
jgi:hypothetical protein